MKYHLLFAIDRHPAFFSLAKMFHQWLMTLLMPFDQLVIIEGANSTRHDRFVRSPKVVVRRNRSEDNISRLSDLIHSEHSIILLPLS